MTLAGTGGGGGLMQPPAVFQEYHFRLSVERHSIFYSLPTTVFAFPLKILRS